jgi:REP element-mobilizing transposase RayT
VVSQVSIDTSTSDFLNEGRIRSETALSRVCHFAGSKTQSQDGVQSRTEEGHVMLAYVYMLLAIPRKYAVPLVIGFIKGKSAVRLARVCGEGKRNFVGRHFWARGYFVATVIGEEAHDWN